MQVIIFVTSVVTLMIGVVSGNPQLGFLNANQQANRPGNVAGNNNGVNNNNLNGNTNNNGGGLLGGALNRQGGLSFVIPGLSLLAGGGNNGGAGGNGNLFGLVTVTRTLVSTVTTVTTPSFRTCTTSAAALMPCAAGRRKRDENAVVNGYQNENKIDATPVMELIIGGTTLIEREAVSEFLEAHRPSTQSVIYPPGVEQVVGERIQINPRLEEVVVAEGTTLLYPSLEDDVGDEEDMEGEKIPRGDEGVGVTTETPILLDGLEETTLEPREGDGEVVEVERAGFGRRTTTVTTVIRVTSVATSLATGTMATLTVSYAGCAPPSLPISGTACV